MPELKTTGDSEPSPFLADATRRMRSEMTVEKDSPCERPLGHPSTQDSPTAPVIDVASSSYAARILIITIAAVFLTEACVMVILTLLPPLSTGVEAVVNSTLLSILVFPVLYLTIFRPLLQQIRSRRRAEAQIRTSLLEKEVLLKGIHHRVKNNLQVIASMLNLQAGHVSDEAALALLRESQNRIRSLALIHEKLYRSSDLAHIDFGDYVRDLADSIVSSVNRSVIPIVVDTVIDDVVFGIDTTIPVGLIVNELVSNSVKHAFHDRIEGRIRISMGPAGDGRLRLIVEDDGVGLPADFEGCTEHTLGLQLVDVLTAQLDGRLSWGGSEAGARFEIEFSNSDFGGRDT